MEANFLSGKTLEQMQDLRGQFIEVLDEVGFIDVGSTKGSKSRGRRLTVEYEVRPEKRDPGRSHGRDGK